jgi:hypothetical protein
MRKLKLDLDSLVVTSFDTLDEHELAGTVLGHNTVPPPSQSCPQIVTCSPDGTCYDSCDVNVCTRTPGVTNCSVQPPVSYDTLCYLCAE